MSSIEGDKYHCKNKKSVKKLLHNKLSRSWMGKDEAENTIELLLKNWKASRKSEDKGYRELRIICDIVELF